MTEAERQKAIRFLSRYVLDVSSIEDSLAVLAGRMTGEEADKAAAIREEAHRRLLGKLDVAPDGSPAIEEEGPTW